MNRGKLLILGATSPVARAAAARFAGLGFPLVLAGPDETELERVASDLRIRNDAEVSVRRFDALDPESGKLFLASTLDPSNPPAGILVASGYLGDAERARTDNTEADRILRINFSGLVPIVSAVAQRLEEAGRGFIVGITSVAGERGRQSNYLYGAAKGAFSLYLQGLRNRLFPAGVSVITVKPGFIDSRMTFGLPGLFFVARPESVADAVVRAVERGRPDVLWTPWFWRWIMLAIRLIPESLFKRMHL